MARIVIGMAAVMVVAATAALPLACNTESSGQELPLEPAPDGGSDAPVGSDGGVDDADIPDADIPDADIPDGSATTTFQLLSDHRFLNGFDTYPVEPSTSPIGSLVPPTATGDPDWRLAEWHTQQLLGTGPPTMTSSGAEWANSYKRVVVSDGFLELAVNADLEYGGVYRQTGEPWPHLLVAQQIFDDAAPQSNVPIHGYASLSLSLSLELVYADHIQETGYDPSLHACQFLMFITLQNRNQAHEDYGNYIWFGLPFYDDRYATLSENIQLDLGTGNYIFRMGSTHFMPASLHDVASVDISVDLLPYMKTAVADAIDQGIFSSANLDDYFLGGMNLGFEVPGRSTATMQVRDLSLMGATDSAP